MGTRENIDYIKQELTSEEKFLESLIKTEKFYKKYKKPLLGGVALLVAIAIGYVAYEAKLERDLELSNAAYTRLMEGKGSAKDRELLQKLNPKLYTLYRYHEALLQRDTKELAALAQEKQSVIADLATYHKAALEAKAEALKGYALAGGIYSDLAKLNEAYLLYKSGKIEEAHQAIATIKATSKAAAYASLLRHYGVAK